jgi:LPXTG-site transpeptidase (sortase) family protein
MLLRAALVNLLILAVLVSAYPATAESPAPGGSPLYFKETGHTLAYNFRPFWEKYGGLAVLGFPITEVYVEEGRAVQYFERARLEWQADSQIVTAGLLGRWAARNYPNHAAFAPVPGKHWPEQDYFVETQHTLGGGFQIYWKANGGLPVFGFPLSEEFQEKNPETGQVYTVQYFERARFEWHPDAPPGYQFQLGLLGREYLQAEPPAAPAALNPVIGPDYAWNGVRPTRITIPRLKLDTDVTEGAFSFKGWEVPRYTAVHYWPVSAWPGTRGNIVVAGHAGYRNTIFDQLPDATVGDEVVVYQGQTERHYLVSVVWKVLPEDTWVMSPTAEETLTLITCVPINVFSHRLIVRASPIQS